jgi:hypothetical protein
MRSGGAIFTHTASSSWLKRQLAIAVLVLMVLGGCDGQEPTYDGPAGDKASGFTFLELGANTPVNADLRDRLKARLGSEAIARRTTINLEPHAPGFLTDNFPDLAELNQRLNYPPLERVEHAVTQITYRYINPKILPFEKVVLLFANPTGLPVLLNAFAGEKGESLEGPLKEKYGPPEEIDWQGGRTLVWTLGQDRLLFTASQDQYDRPRHQITIYYTENLKQLMSIEGSGKKAPADDGKSIF